MHTDILLVPSLSIILLRLGTAYTSLIQDPNGQENSPSSFTLSPLVTVSCLIEETASNLYLLFQSVIQEIKQSAVSRQPALNKGSRVDGAAQESLLSPEFLGQGPKNASALITMI
jgi:hypothetical protein